MNEDEARQSKIPDEPEYSPLRLQPIEQVLRQGGATEDVIVNYPILLRHDMHLAELYRLSSVLTHDTRVAGLTQKQKKRLINPLQARVDRKNRVWVDVLFERHEHVTLRELKKVMKVRTRVNRLISGTVLAENLPELIKMARRLRTAKPVSSQLRNSVPFIKADQPTLQFTFPNANGLDGRNTIIGIVDFGCDFKHANFIKESESRILFLWDQNGRVHPNPSTNSAKPKNFTAPKKFSYGVEYTQEDINNALIDRDPYKYLGYKPDNATTEESRGTQSHGTQVMDIAAGTSSLWQGITQGPGVAPGADIIFVHLGNSDASTEEEELKSMGGSTKLFDAVKYIFTKVDDLNKKMKQIDPNHLDLPVVINISLGANGGAHDGTSCLETMFDRMLNAKRGRAIVIAAGNSFAKDMHVYETIEPGSQHTIDWIINNERPPASWDIRQELEIWYTKSAKLRVELREPEPYGQVIGSCTLGEYKALPISGASSMPVIISHLPPDPEPGEDANHIDILLDSRDHNFKMGKWRIHLVNVSDVPASYNAWVEDNPKYPSILSPSTTATTLNAIGNAKLPILVGACGRDSFGISTYSSAGPSLNENWTEKPDICAPGSNVWAAEELGRGYAPAYGTSFAAPHIAGVIALMFQAAREFAKNKRVLSIREMRQLLLDTATYTAVPGKNPGYDTRYGFGVVNTVEALKKIEIL